MLCADVRSEGEIEGLGTLRCRRLRRGNYGLTSVFSYNGEDLLGIYGDTLPVQVKSTQTLQELRTQVSVGTDTFGPEHVQLFLEVIKLGIIGVTVFKEAAQVIPDITCIEAISCLWCNQHLNTPPAFLVLSGNWSPNSNWYETREGLPITGMCCNLDLFNSSQSFAPDVLTV